MAAAFILNFFHYELSPADQTILIDTIPEVIQSVSAAIGTILAIYGRVTAKTTIG